MTACRDMRAVLGGRESEINMSRLTTVRPRFNRAVVILSLLCCAYAAAASNPQLPQLFAEAKTKFNAGDHKGSLADFEKLDELSARPGHEKDRAQLLPVVTFYRGANLAALGRKEEAREAFVAYLGYAPTATIQSPPYPKATVQIFDSARKEAAGRSTGIVGAYARFVVPAGWTLEPDERWADTPIRYLLSGSEKKMFSELRSDADRAAFISRFWNAIDPSDGTSTNELRMEIEKRIAFADTTFGTEKLAGRFTDRAAVFVFLGAPTFATEAALTSGDDMMSALRTGGNEDMRRLSKAGSTALTPRPSSDNLEQEGNRGRREAWHYRGSRVPSGLSHMEVRFDFLTKKGYGDGVLQKEAISNEVLGRAAATARETGKLN